MLILNQYSQLKPHHVFMIKTHHTTSASLSASTSWGLLTILRDAWRVRCPDGIGPWAIGLMRPVVAVDADWRDYAWGRVPIRRSGCMRDLRALPPSHGSCRREKLTSYDARHQRQLPPDSNGRERYSITDSPPYNRHDAVRVSIPRPAFPAHDDVTRLSAANQRRFTAGASGGLAS